MFIMSSRRNSEKNKNRSNKKKYLKISELTVVNLMTSKLVRQSRAFREGSALINITAKVRSLMMLMIE